MQAAGKTHRRRRKSTQSEAERRELASDEIESLKYRPTTDNRYEVDGLESFIYTSSIKVEYYRSFEYCEKWEIPMYPRRSTRLPKASKKSPQRRPNPKEEVFQHKLRSDRQRNGLRETKNDISVGNADEERDRDIIDIINSTHNAKHIMKEDEEKSVEVADEGVDMSNEDSYSVTSSVASGPSFALSTPKILRPSQDMCSACQKLYHRAKKMKTPIKNKLLDNDPKSLTCDQWVLIKSRRPRSRSDARGKLLTEVQQIKESLNSAKQMEQSVGGEPSSCSRLHTFLQRNLRRQSVRVSVKKSRKKNRRKRKRDDFWSSRNTKKQRLHSNGHRQHSSIGCINYNGLPPANGQSSSPGSGDCTEQEVNNETDADLTVGLLPSTVSLDNNKLREVPPKQKAPKKTTAFRDLLVQLRSNSSMIVREMRK